MRRTTGAPVGLMILGPAACSGETPEENTQESLRDEAVEVQEARDALADDLGC